MITEDQFIEVCRKYIGDCVIEKNYRCICCYVDGLNVLCYNLDNGIYCVKENKLMYDDGNLFVDGSSDNPVKRLSSKTTKGLENYLSKFMKRYKELKKQYRIKEIMEL